MHLDAYSVVSPIGEFFVRFFRHRTSTVATRNFIALNVRLCLQHNKRDAKLSAVRLRHWTRKVVITRLENRTVRLSTVGHVSRIISEVEV